MFIRGLAQENLQERYEGYKALYKIGVPAVPHIREAILKADWSKIKRPNEARYVGGLVSLLRDISEVEAERIAGHLITNGCDPVIRQIVSSICKFKLDDYETYNMHGVQIYEHKALAGLKVRLSLEGWLKNVPPEDLREIERLYVIRDDGRSSAGSYTPILFNIKVIWDETFSSRNPLSWLLLLQVEFTLYHEIGHHLHRHTFGQMPEQEREADEYAKQLMKISHPVLTQCAQSIFKGMALLGLRARSRQTFD